MVGRCFEWMLIVLGTVMVAAAVLPYVILFRIPEPYATELTALKLLMLPAGAICLGSAAWLSARIHR